MQRAFDEGVAPLHWEADLDWAAAAASAPKLFLANYEVKNNRAARAAAHSYFCNGLLANYSSCSSSNDQDLPAYFRRVRQHMFNVAPEGAGLDSYRCALQGCKHGMLVSMYHLAFLVSLESCFWAAPCHSNKLLCFAGFGRPCTSGATRSCSTRELLMLPTAAGGGCNLAASNLENGCACNAPHACHCVHPVLLCRTIDESFAGLPVWVVER